MPNILSSGGLRFSGGYEYRADFGVVNTLAPGKNYEGEQTRNVGADIIFLKIFSVSGGYDSRFGGGGGLVVRFQEIKTNSSPNLFCGDQRMRNAL